MVDNQTPENPEKKRPDTPDTEKQEQNKDKDEILDTGTSGDTTTNTSTNPPAGNDVLRGRDAYPRHDPSGSL